MITVLRLASTELKASALFYDFSYVVIIQDHAFFSYCESEKDVTWNAQTTTFHTVREKYLNEECFSETYLVNATYVVVLKCKSH